MAGTLTWELLRELAGFRAARGCAISLFVNLDPSVAPTAGDAATRVSSLLTEGERLLDARRNQLSHEQRTGLKTDLERIARWFDDEFDRDGAHGVAVYADELDGLWRPLPLVRAVPDGLRVEDELYLAPLVGQVGLGDGTVVAHVGREQGQVFRLRATRLEPVADESDEVPGRHDQGGWSQARYERHIEKLVGDHLRRVADTLERRVRRRPESRVVIVATDETRGELEELLAKEVRDAVVGWTTARAHATPAELLEAVAPVLNQADERAEAELLDRWREEAGRNGRASAGWKETLTAASDGRVERLLVQERAVRKAYRCPRCGRGEAEAGACPLDGTPLEERDGLDLAVHHTLRNGGTVHVVRGHRDLEPVEGIGALLRF